MKKLRIAALTCWALALVPVVGTSAQSTSTSSPTLDAYGWWNKTQALPVQGDPSGLGLPEVSVPAPPTVPEDGLYVSNEASGPAAFSAVRYRAGGGTLTLALAEGAALTGAEEIAACKIPGGFQPAQNGRWDAAPAYDEVGCAEAVAAEDGSSLTFEAPAAWASTFGDISIAIVPTPGSATPFSLAFAAPTDSSFAGSGASTGSSSMPPASSFSPSPSGSSSFTAPKPSGSFATPSAPSVATPTTVAGDEVAAPVTVPATPAASTAPEPSDTAKWVAMALLVGIGAALWVLSSRQARAPRLLGSIGSGAVAVAPAPVADTRPRGVGRFARPRSAPPTAI